MNILSGILGIIVFFATTIWPSESIFQLDSSWNNDLGQSVKLDRVNSKPTLITLIYTHCATACPVVVHRLMKINELAKKEGIPLHITLVSMDTKRDSPKRLNAFRKEQNLIEEDWSLLSGSEDEVRALSVALGFSYQRVEDSMEIMHSNRLVLLNGVGEIKQTFDGLNQTAEDIIAEVKKLPGTDIDALQPQR